MSWSWVRKGNRRVQRSPLLWSGRQHLREDAPNGVDTKKWLTLADCNVTTNTTSTTTTTFALTGPIMLGSAASIRTRCSSPYMSLAEIPIPIWSAPNNSPPPPLAPFPFFELLLLGRLLLLPPPLKAATSPSTACFRVVVGAQHSKSTAGSSLPRRTQART